MFLGTRSNLIKQQFPPVKATHYPFRILQSPTLKRVVASPKLDILIPQIPFAAGLIVCFLLRVEYYGI